MEGMQGFRQKNTTSINQRLKMSVEIVLLKPMATEVYTKGRPCRKTGRKYLCGGTG